MSLKKANFFVPFALSFTLSLVASCSDPVGRPKFGTSGSIDQTQKPIDPSTPGPDKNDLPIGEPSGVIPEGRLWRLTNEQYAELVDAQLGRKTGLLGLFDPSDSNEEFFGHEPQFLGTDTAYITNLEFNINKVVKASSANLEKQLGCPLASVTADCLNKFVEAFASKAFHRPVTDAEKKNYWNLYSALLSKAGSKEAFTAVVEVILRSPNTLFRSEVGENKDGVIRLSPSELAVALSYALTNSAPDDELMSKAKDGSLLKDDVYLAQAKRLLASDKFAKTFADYALRWSKAYWIEAVTKMSDDFDDNLKKAMKQEVIAFSENIIKKDGASFIEFMTSRRTTITEPLAEFYSAGSFQGSKEITASEKERSGIITLPGVIAAMSSDYTAPMHRAQFFIKNVMCDKMPAVPDVIDEVKPADGTKSFRERFVAHQSEPSCKACHLQMDPYGFSLENLDGSGRYRTMEDNLPIDAKGLLVRSEGEIKFDSAMDLLPQLAKYPGTQKCFVDKVFGYVNGREPEVEDGVLLDNVYKKFVDSGLNMSQVFLELVTADNFKLRKEGK